MSISVNNKYKTIEHHGLEAPTGDHVQKSKSHLKKVKYSINNKNNENNLKQFTVAACTLKE